MIILMFDQRQSVTKYLGNDESGGIDATNAVLFVVLQSAILQLPPFNYMALSIRSSNPSAVSSHIVYKNIYSLSRREAGYGSPHIYHPKNKKSEL